MPPLQDGWTLPASWYSDGAVAALERESEQLLADFQRRLYDAIA